MRTPLEMWEVVPREVFIVFAGTVTLIAIICAYKVFINKPAAAEGGVDVREVPSTDPVLACPESVLRFFANERALFGQPLTTERDIEIEAPGTVYYLISGRVEIYSGKELIAVKEKDFFVTVTEFLVSSPASKPDIMFVIKKKSLVYKVIKPNEECFLFMALSRFFHSSLYVQVNYFEIIPPEYDIKSVGEVKKTNAEILMQVEKSMVIGRKIYETEILKIDNRKKILNGNSLYVVISGNPFLVYKRKRVQLKEGDVFGCLNRVTILSHPREIEGPAEILEMYMGPSEGNISSMTALAREYILLGGVFLALTDACVDWRILQPGEIITWTVPSKSIKIVRCGYFLKENSVKYFGIGAGRVLFEKEIILERDFRSSAVAARVSEIAEIPSEYISFVLSRYSTETPFLYKRILAQAVEEEHLDPPRLIGFISNNVNEIQIEVFIESLNAEINVNDTCTILSSEMIKKILGDKINQIMCSIYLLDLISYLQESYAYILLPVVTENRLCASVHAAQNLSEIMFYLAENGDTTELDLEKTCCKIDSVILHRDNRRRVLSGRYYGQRHHMEFPLMDSEVLEAIPKKQVNDVLMRKRNLNLGKNFFGPKENITASFPSAGLKRFIRTLKGENVGLVLGGGGARGISHIGIIQALEEAGIPIDAVGGTSMGAFVGALYATSCNNGDVFAKTKKIAKQMTSMWRILLDMTYPICSMFTGESFNWALKNIFKSQKIEDLWLPYYCITTDISVCEEKVHRFGLLWRYVRASMSLSGYVPPICDKGSFLLDGGYVNNVPVDVMRMMGIRNIIAVDVGSEFESNYENYGDSVNGFYILFHKIFGTKKFLPLTEIQYRLSYITSSHKERHTRSDMSIKYIKPDLTGYKTGNFRYFDEIVAHGYECGKKAINDWKKTGEYEDLVWMGERRTQSKSTTP